MIFLKKKSSTKEFFVMQALVIMKMFYKEI